MPVSCPCCTGWIVFKGHRCLFPVLRRGRKDVDVRLKTSGEVTHVEMGSVSFVFVFLLGGDDFILCLGVIVSELGVGDTHIDFSVALYNWLSKYLCLLFPPFDKSTFSPGVFRLFV